MAAVYGGSQRSPPYQIHSTARGAHNHPIDAAAQDSISPVFTQRKTQLHVLP